uniref:Mab-21 domain-containing protein n=1 Tax=Angiostrongylus cantonensis TaxID=6313 RepID=A0A0K0D1W3_ANGCA
MGRKKPNKGKGKAKAKSVVIGQRPGGETEHQSQPSSRRTKDVYGVGDEDVRPASAWYFHVFEVDDAKIVLSTLLRQFMMITKDVFPLLSVLRTKVVTKRNGRTTIGRVSLANVKRINRGKASKETTPTKSRSISKPGEGADENGQPQDSQEHLRELTARALNGMTSTDFRDRMLSSLRTYKAMSTLDAGTRPVFQPYLRRNLLYRMAFADRPTPSYTFGEREPPLVWPWGPVQAVHKDVEERKRHLSELIEALVSRASVEEEIQRCGDSRSFRFSIKTLAAFKRTKDVQVLYRSLAYRKFLRARGMAVPAVVKSHTEFLNGTSDPDRNVCRSSVLEDTATLSFRMVCHHLLEGERLAKVQVYTVQQKGEEFGRAERLPSATFTVCVNFPLQPVSIDVPTISGDSDLRVYVLVRVDVTNNLKGIQVDGHALRHLPNRVVRTDAVNQDDTVAFERLHTNPFLQMRVVCGPIYDDESDSIFSERTARSSDGVDGDDELSAYSELEDAIPQQVELKRTVDPYLGVFRPGDDGKYVNHIRTIEAIFRPLKSMSRIHLIIIQNWLRLEIPSLITYRISSGMAPCDADDEPAAVFKGKPIPRDPRVDENWHRLHIDVFLNPDFDDVDEVSSTRNNWIKVVDPFYIWTRDQAVELRSKLRMDLTIFCDSLKSAGQTWDDPVEERRFIHPESGRWLYRGERLPRYARHLPAPGHQVLIHNTTRRLLDFVDLSDGSKWFMITWNTMMITLGKARCDEAGTYWLNLSKFVLNRRFLCRLFLELHMDTMIRYRQRSHFIYQLNTHTQRGRSVTDLEDLVLRLKSGKHDYDPLLDEMHPIRDMIYADLKRGYERYRSDRDKPHKDPSGMRRSFPKMYRTDPSTMPMEQLHKLCIEILEAGVVIPFNHSFRKYLLNVVDVLFEGEMPPCIASLRDQDDFLRDLIRGRELA